METLRRKRNPDTGEVFFGGGFFSTLAAKLTGKTASKLASKAAEKLVEKGAEKVGEETGKLLGETVYDKLSKRKKAPASVSSTPENKGEEIRKILRKESSKSMPAVSKEPDSFQYIRDVYKGLL